MDFTLLKYGAKEHFHQLCFDCFSRSIVEKCGWHPKFRKITKKQLKIGMEFITIDQNTGNLLKVADNGAI